MGWFILLRITNWGAFLSPDDFYGILTEERQRKIQKERDSPKQFKVLLFPLVAPKHKIKSVLLKTPHALNTGPREIKLDQT